MVSKSSAIVIGSGFGGLALAIRLQSAGIATTVIEARDRPGGRAYVWKRDGYTFDAGPTVITDPACLEELWSLSGQRRGLPVRKGAWEVRPDPVTAGGLSLPPAAAGPRLCRQDAFP